MQSALLPTCLLATLPFTSWLTAPASPANLPACPQDGSAQYFVSTLCTVGNKRGCLQVTSSINNIIVGKLYIDHGGVMRIQNKKTDLAAKIKFKETGLLGGSKNAHQVSH